MAKYLFTTLPSNDLDLLARSLPVARELARNGDEIVFCSPGKSPRKITAEAGFENLLPAHPGGVALGGGYGLRRLMPIYAAWKARTGGTWLSFWGEAIRGIPTRFAKPTSRFWNTDHASAAAGLLNPNFLRFMSEAYLALIEQTQVDVIVNFWNPFAAIAARAARIPLVSFVQVDEHPAGRGFIWWEEPPADLPTCVPAINEVLAGYRLDPVEKTEELALGDLTLVVGIPETDPLPESAEGVYVGPLLWQRDEESLPAWVEALDRSRPVIWLYPGNIDYGIGMGIVSSEIVLSASIEALVDQDVQVVLTTGYHPLPKRYASLPPNFRHEPYLPGRALAARADLLIHHGGYGSCQTGLVTGTPAVIIPTFAERESNARRLAAVGAVEFVIPREDRRGRKSVDIAELRAKIERVLGDESYCRNAEAISRKLQTYGGAALAAELIRRFVDLP